jgi:hypothetical protein
MNLFRSEEHIRNWPSFDPASEEGIVPLAQLVEMFSENLFQRRLDPDYFSLSQEYMGELLTALTELGKDRPFWSPPNQ